MVNISAARSALETLYFDTATIIEYREVFNPEDGSTGVEEVVLCENQPCKISHEDIKYNYDRDASDGVMLASKLFIRPELIIKSGSKIIVTRNGVSTTYKNSSEPARYMNHQEIKMELWKEEA